MRKFRHPFSLVFASLFLFSLGWGVDKTLDIAANAMDVSEMGSEITMENVVNAKTPGYKEVTQYARFNPKTGFQERSRFNKMSIGAFVNTGRALDFALENEGFFVLKDPRGRIFLTRDGRFEINEKRQLIYMAGGFLVLGADLSPIDLPPFTSFKVDKRGQIYDQENNLLARIGVVKVADTKLLKTPNNVLFYRDDKDKMQLEEVEQASIKQGFYEASNVDYSKTLTKMAATGGYGANVNIIQTRLKMLDTMIEMVNKN
ncbi:MAG: flagellar basal body rod C-terminal domain-containing protein [Candidatus Margulisiibacteriota bacterium]